MALEEDELTERIVARLESDSTLMGMLNGGVGEVYSRRTASPFVLVSRLDGEDIVVVGLHRVWVDTTYHIRGAYHWRGGGERPDRTEVNAIGARIDVLLHDWEELTADVHIHGFREEPEPNPVVTESDGTWLQAGGIYRLRATAV